MQTANQKKIVGVTLISQEVEFMISSIPRDNGRHFITVQ